MSLVKIPLMDKKEYDNLIKSNYISRIAFNGDYPYMAPFLYVFDGDYLYFLSTKYGKKIEMLGKNPLVAVEIEEYSPDLSKYQFVTLQGRIEEEKDPKKQRQIREMFAELIMSKKLSTNIMAALGHSPDDPISNLVEMECSYVWKLVDVEKIIGIKNS
ncbi:pyridoxamine 5'-phosphate oxidase family protein [Methanobacterium alcaliphilum]|nr:pyridoxamine 5'-phosphate oxidase family protein [Methanobacterium alcaliphilum]MCK9150533.1 pyridoxamine 5'-phosphate oxidase family protein [Methanobacterium alcaliphilum]